MRKNGRRAGAGMVVHSEYGVDHTEEHKCFIDVALRVYKSSKSSNVVISVSCVFGE